MKMTTALEYKGNELGIVSGSCVTSRVFFRDFIAGIRHFFGWELIEYTEMIDKAREIALQRMQENAEKLGATQVINVRLETSETSRGAAEIVAYGTAVK